MDKLEKREIPFSPPDITDLEIKNVVEVLKSGWITTGPKTKELEKKITKWLGTSEVVCLNSQTAAAETGLRLLGIGENDEVIVPAYTYSASASVVCHVGANLVLVDCQQNSLEMDYDALEAAITEKTKVIIPVDLGGIPCNYDRIFEIVEKKRNLFHPSSEIQKAYGRIIVMADAAHAFGANWHDQMVGNVADLTTFSFHAVKNFTTAEGGALVWKEHKRLDNEAMYHQCQLLSLHGQSKDALEKTQLGSWEYDIVGPWYKYNMSDITAAIGIAQFDRYSSILARRKEIIEKYDKAFKPLGIELLTHYTDEYNSSGHLYITRIPNITAEQRNEIIMKMAEKGIACNVHYKPLPMHTAYKSMGFDIQDFPNAYAHFENEITLPLYTKITNEEIAYVINQYSDIVKGYI
ncbi:DegT/DnrJ/EryC1/StrS family aminotransferase [Enterococcus faecium]|uniref:DegT/DnrJ/EryC1/StrS family aminotransferase n=1 Tax=Enterococcus faecium TaxID=1352 RepID=UPI002019BCE1|nr:DegT/DnrJ/EryC1/StrS family aminotransferase [Enterococcus faecium]NTK68312.1 DegT/DnrJ/EryC1/StrS family aminotransferase [Enterococcus faecium]UQR32308.1 DegT/DnrJ/EryC1/StrS family aminotransferase [Enterococcus faecium]